MKAVLSGGLFGGREAEIESAEPIIVVEGIPAPMEHWTPPQVMTSQKYELQQIMRDGSALYMGIE